MNKHIIEKIHFDEFIDKVGKKYKNKIMIEFLPKLFEHKYIAFFGNDISNLDNLIEKHFLFLNSDTITKSFAMYSDPNAITLSSGNKCGSCLIIYNLTIDQAIAKTIKLMNLKAFL